MSITSKLRNKQKGMMKMRRCNGYEKKKEDFKLESLKMGSARSFINNISISILLDANDISQTG